jgi:large subunit ribosomal protein L17
MRHRKRTAKLGRTGEHRNAMLANLVCSLIKERRVTTTLAKARAARPVAEKMVTLGKRGSIHHRRLAAARLHQEDAVRILFNEIAPQQKDRPGGYTRIVKMHRRQGDAAKLAILEWVDAPLPDAPAAESAEASVSPAPTKAKSKSKKPKTKAAPPSEGEDAAPAAPAPESAPETSASESADADPSDEPDKK